MLLLHCIAIHPIALQLPSYYAATIMFISCLLQLVKVIDSPLCISKSTIQSGFLNSSNKSWKDKTQNDDKPSNRENYRQPKDAKRCAVVANDHLIISHPPIFIGH